MNLQWNNFTVIIIIAVDKRFSISTYQILLGIGVMTNYNHESM